MKAEISFEAKRLFAHKSDLLFDLLDYLIVSLYQLTLCMLSSVIKMTLPYVL